MESIHLVYLPREISFFCEYLLFDFPPTLIVFPFLGQRTLRDALCSAICSSVRVTPIIGRTVAESCIASTKHPCSSLKMGENAGFISSLLDSSEEVSIFHSFGRRNYLGVCKLYRFLYSSGENLSLS